MREVRDRPLHHLTLNTGHVAATPRSEVASEIVDRLLPVVDAQGGKVPGMEGFSIDIHHPLAEDRMRPLPGAAFFQIDPPGAPQGSKTPIVVAVACWRDDMAEDAWAQLRDVVLPLERVAGGVRWPAGAPAVPWLAVLILPWAMSVPPADMTAVGDLERCLFWAMIESE